MPYVQKLYTTLWNQWHNKTGNFQVCIEKRQDYINPVGIGLNHYDESYSDVCRIFFEFKGILSLVIQIEQIKIWLRLKVFKSDSIFVVDFSINFHMS